MKRSIFYVVLSLISISAFSQSDLNSNDKKLLVNNVVQDSLSEYSIKPVTVANLEYPLTINPEEIISHIGYSFLFSNKDKQAVWIAYQLTSEETVKLFNRSDKFTPDKSVKSGTANDNDYKGSGYDRGHLAPAAYRWSIK
jgi:endonuclease G